MYYDLHTLLSYNNLFNFVIGNRGSGKTYSSKRWCIKGFIKDGSQFIYLRRYKTEFVDLKNFFADILDEFPDHKFEIKGKNFYIDGELAGYSVPLSTALTKKSVSYHRVNKIVFDEFVIDSKVIHYLNNEVTHFLEFYETVARMRDNVRVLFLSNAVSVVNPYFIYWNIRPNNEQRFHRQGEILVEFVKNDDFIEAKYKTKFGQIIKGTDYGNYAVENEFLKDNKNFVEAKGQHSRFQFSVIFNGNIYGFWTNYKEGLMYMSEDYDPSSKLQYAVSDHEHKPNLMLIKSVSKSPLLKNALAAYEGGYLRFESIRIKNQFLDMFSLLRS